jgi:anaerobic magnesium-protoporphyrin IX monomethyl ester cyclase
MKILLFNPPTIEGKRFIREGRCTQEEGAWGTLWPPVSLASAAAVLEKAGHDIRLRDFPACGEDLAVLDDAVRDFQPDVAIWSSATPSIDSDLSIAERLKALQPALKTCTFSTHAATLADQCLRQHRGLDFIIRGEPELTVDELLDALAGHRTIDSVPGLAFLNSAGLLTVTAERDLPKDLDALPDPAWHLLDLSAYRLPLKGRPFLMVVPTRGCPYACSFCTTHSYYGKNLRRRSPTRVVAELQRNITTFGIRDFLFWSDTFTLDKTHVKELCQAIIAANLQIQWAANSRVDTADLKTFQKMRQAGCWMVSFGIESGSQTVLDQLKKGADVAEAKQAVGWAKQAGLQVAGHFVLGLPGDSEVSIRETIHFSRTLALDFAQYYCAVPFPGSSLYVEAKQKGWLPDTPWEDFRQDKAILRLPGLAPDVVQRLRNQASLQFYTSPRNWLSKIAMLRPAAIPDVLRRLKELVGWRHAEEG